MALSGYSPETERKAERLLVELYDALQIQKPDDLFGSICIETRYQNGKPIGQVDVQVRYVMKRNDGPRKVELHEHRPDVAMEIAPRRRITR